MSRRLLGVLCSLLLFSTLVVTIYAWKLKSRLDRAEWFVQSGADSVFFVCSPVLQSLRQPGEVDVEMLAVARECLGQVPVSEAQPAADDFRRKDVTAITKRIQAKLDDREFPYSTSHAVEDRYLPKSYRN